MRKPRSGPHKAPFSRCGGVMGFSEIAKRLGISKHQAYYLFHRGMSKLLARPAVMRRLKEIAINQDRMAALRPTLTRISHHEY
jgi:hypothetical protein